MLTPLDFFRTNLRAGCTPEADILYINPVDRKKLDRIGVGNHTYLTLIHGRFREVVRYDHVENYVDAQHKNQINITRDIQTTGRKTFPVGSCVIFAWIEQAIQEFKDEVSQ